MSRMNCIDGSRVATDSMKAELRAQINEYLAQTGLTDSYQVALSVRSMTEAAKREAEAKKLVTLRHLARQRDIFTSIDAHPKGKRFGAYGTIETDPFQAANAQSNYMVNSEAWKAMLYRAGGHDLAALRDTWSGAVRGLVTFSDRAKLELNQALLDHWGGRGTNNPLALRIARAWERIAEEAFQQMRGMGVTIGRIDGYKPQALDGDRLFERTALGGRGNVVIEESEFVADLMSAIDRSRENPLSQRPWTDTELRIALSAYYETLATGGANKLRSNYGKQGLQVAHDTHRVFHFTDEGWSAVMEKYGPRDLVSALFRYIDNVASDLAEIDTWGPRPAAQRDAIMLRLRQNGDAQGADRFDRMWTIASGQTGALPGASNWWQLAPSLRHTAMIVQLGRAAIASLFGDPKNVVIRSIYNDSSVLRHLEGVIASLPNNEARFAFAQEQLQIWESGYGGATSLLKRLGDTHWASNWVGSRGAKVINASGLGAITQAARLSAQQMYEVNLARHWSKSFAEVERDAPDLAIKLREWGIDRVWDQVSGVVPLIEVPGSMTGARTIDFGALLAHDRAAALTIKKYIIGETRQTIISSNVHGDAMLGLHTRAGTGVGEGIRFGTQYLKYPAAYFHAMWRPLLGVGTRRMTKAKVFGALVTMPVVTGVLMMWTNDLLRGNSPTPLVLPDGSFNVWPVLKAFMSQDGVPFLGQMMLKALGWDDPAKWTDPRAARGVQAEHVARLTPVSGLLYREGKEIVVDPLRAAVAPKSRDDLQGELAGALKEIMRTAGSFLGLNIWYAQIAFNHLILEGLEESLDPIGYRQRIARVRQDLRIKGQSNVFLAP